jgi:hypothetical protein
MRKGKIKRQFEKVYSSVPPEVKKAIEAEAERRGLQVSDVVRELLMEKFGKDNQKSLRSSL